MSKRTLDAFFTSSSPAKKLRQTDQQDATTAHVAQERAEALSVTDVQGMGGLDLDDPSGPSSTHTTYPHAILDLPVSVLSILGTLPASPSRSLPPRPNLDCLYFTPFVPRATAKRIYEHLLHSLPFYRVKYTIVRGQNRTSINTPRYTTIFGVDDSARWTDCGELVATATRQPIVPSKYKRAPRPLPACLNHLRLAVEKVTGARYNFCLVNYYADGNDSISPHSDDERFLGKDPCIASLSFGGTRDFHLKPKPPVPSSGATMSEGAGSGETIKLQLESGDMIVMRGSTQSNWLHAIPKRKGEQGKRGRINVTFRRALVPQGTDNYYNYNVGDGAVWRWDAKARAMLLWNGNLEMRKNAYSQTLVNWR